MITVSNSFNTVDMGRYFAILPAEGDIYSNFQRVGSGKGYGSDTNSEFRFVERLRELIVTSVVRKKEV